MNFWLGGAYTMHFPREILKKYENINSPILPMMIQGDKHAWIYDSMSAEKSISPALKWIYYSQDKEECNLGTYNLTLEDENDYFFKYFLSYSPPGTRFWFFKLNSIDLFLKEYDQSLLDPINTDWIKNRKMINPKLSNLSREDMVNLMHERLDKMADKYDALPGWKPFTPDDYFGNGDKSETDFSFRLYTKP
jgi:hypothetical protein